MAIDREGSLTGHWGDRTLLAAPAVSAVLLVAGTAATLWQGERHAQDHDSVRQLLLLAWTLRRDWLFAGAALLVLALLILSLSLGVG